MSWQIGIHKNTLVITENTANKLRKLFEETYEEDLELYSIKSGLYEVGFISDYMEHMDVLWKPEIHSILTADDNNGEVIFMSGEGDNAGDIWGYRYVHGECTILEGDIVIKDKVF